MDKSYSDFKSFLFEREWKAGGPKWFFAEDFYDPVFEEGFIVDCALQIFREIDNIWANHSEPQFVLGLQYLIDRYCGITCFSFLSDQVPISTRESAISLMFEVFEKVFAKACANADNPTNMHLPSYNYLCFMWWYVFPRHGAPRTQKMKIIDSIILNNLEKTLLLDNVTCKKAALHGLGCWQPAYDEEVQKILTRNALIIPECLLLYAARAAVGDVQ
ncbi:hypothetical protein [Nevskia soli]|uniref:hypothetical protein n=1 Tax=Nevskia soli TaxID=418856 RepID=UPI0012F9C4ED|nr:hypothetical protein [Nevskia soli]